VPPGPPVIATLAAEVYAEPGVSYAEQIAAAQLVRERMAVEDKVVDVDDTVEFAQPRLHFVVDREKAALSGIAGGDRPDPGHRPGSGEKVGTVHVDSDRNPLHIELRLPVAERSSAAALASLSVRGRSGHLVRLSELGSFVDSPLEPTIYHKNLERVVYVFGEMAGKSPVNAVLNLSDHFEKNPLPTGTRVVWSGEGEWKITLDVFRDLGIAFGAALVLIFILLLIETGSVGMPLIIMGAIPLTMIGIMPGFWLLNLVADRPIGGYDTPVFFTATAMIGMIALAGIVVRNSIILIDFIHHALRRGAPQGGDPRERRGAPAPDPAHRRRGADGELDHHPRPDLLGLAWAIIFGVFASTAFTLVVIPVVYWLIYGRKAEEHERRFLS
jgi:multidrug efflux pump subunit AcrB